MGLELVSDAWKAIKSTFDSTDIEASATSLVNFLIDEGFEPSEIKQVFKGDRHIKDALDYFLEPQSDQYFDDEDSEEYDDHYEE